MPLNRFLLIVFLVSIWPFIGKGLQADKADSVQENSKADTIVQFSIHQKIGPSAWRKTKRAFNLLQNTDADHLLLHLNTYGGRVAEADSIKTRLLNAPVPVTVFVDPNAASAGALISIACSKIYMSPSATMGAATVVNQKGKKMPEKYQSYMRGTIRATAQARGRDPKIAEAMVDEDIDLEGIAPEGELLTFTRSEAIENDYCDGKATTVNDVLEKEGLETAAVVEPEASFIDQIIGLLINPAVSSTLILLMLGGLYFELQSPGLGFPIAASIIAAILYFAPLYLEGLAANWEIALFIIGIILIAVELFVIPGFGVSGISGLVIVLFSLVLSLIRNDFFDFTFTRGDEVLTALLTVASSLVVGTTLLLIFGKGFINSQLFQRMVLQETLSKPGNTLEQENQGEPSSEEPKSQQTQSLKGQTGLAYTDMGPSGKIKVRDEIYEGVSEGEFIEKGQTVKIIKASANRLVVRPKDNE